MWVIVLQQCSPQARTPCPHCTFPCTCGGRPTLFFRARCQESGCAVEFASNSSCKNKCRQNNISLYCHHNITLAQKKKIDIVLERIEFETGRSAYYDCDRSVHRRDSYLRSGCIDVKVSFIDRHIPFLPKPCPFCIFLFINGMSKVLF